MNATNSSRGDKIVDISNSSSGRSSLTYAPEEGAHDEGDVNGLAFPERIYREAVGTNTSADEDILRFCEPVLCSDDSNASSSSSSSSK